MHAARQPAVRAANTRDGSYRCPSTPVQAGRRTTRRRTVGRSHSMRWERASGGQKAKVAASSLESSLVNGKKKRTRTTPQGGTQHHRGAPAHRARTHRRGGAAGAHRRGAQHRRARGPQGSTTPRGAPAHKGAAPTRQQPETKLLSDPQARHKTDGVSTLAWRFSSLGPARLATYGHIVLCLHCSARAGGLRNSMARHGRGL